MNGSFLDYLYYLFVGCSVVCRWPEEMANQVWSMSPLGARRFALLVYMGILLHMVKGGGADASKDPARSSWSKSPMVAKVELLKGKLVETTRPALEPKAKAASPSPHSSPAASHGYSHAPHGFPACRCVSLLRPIWCSCPHR